MRPVQADTTLAQLLTACAVLLPFGIAISRASASPQWQADAASLRDVAWMAGTLDGALSTVLTQGMSLLPIGNLSFRHTLVGCLALAVACYALFGIIRRLLGSFDSSSRLPLFIAAVATITAGQSGAWQREATMGGGDMVAVALVMLGWSVASRLTDRRAPTLSPGATRSWLLLSLIATAACCEHLLAGVALLLMTGAMLLTTGKLPRGATLWGIPVVAGVAALALAGGQLLRTFAPAVQRSVVSLQQQAAAGAASSAALVLHGWLAEAGIVTLALAAIGLAFGIWRDSQRHLMTGVVTLLLADLLLPLSGFIDPSPALRCLAVAAIALAAGSGVTQAALFLRELKVPMARPAAVLVVVFHCTIVAVTAEEAAYAADRSEHIAAEAWTDEALGALPPNAAVVVRSAELTQRLWTAQQLGGRRPDVLVVSAHSGRSRSATLALLPHEPTAKQLLRDLALTGKASEVALSDLADSRPLLLELDPAWQPNVLHHLRVDGAWLSYSPQSLGRSERKTKGAHVLAPSGRVSAPIRSSHAPDNQSQRIVVRTLKQHITALAAIGMRDAAQRVLDEVSELAPNDPFVTGARLRLAHAARVSRRQRPVQLRDLLRY